MPDPTPSAASLEEAAEFWTHSLSLVPWKTIVHPHAPDPRNWHESVPDFAAMGKRVALALDAARQAGARETAWPEVTAFVAAQDLLESERPDFSDAALWKVQETYLALRARAADARRDE